MLANIICEPKAHLLLHCTPCYQRELEKEMAARSSILAWKIPRTEAPGGLQSVGLLQKS